MKDIKMLGLGAIAAAVAMACLGAATASATVLCENNQTSGCTKDVAAGTKVAFTSESSITLTGPFSITLITCTAVTVDGNTTSTGGAAATVSGSITKLIFNNCNRVITPNSETTGTFQIHHQAGTDNGTFVSDDTTILIHEVSFPFPATCAYLTKNTTIGTITGSLSQPTVDLQGTIPTETINCPDADLDGKLNYTGTTPFIVGAS